MLIRCCTYSSPFKIEQSGLRLPQYTCINRKSEDYNWPDWIEVSYLPSWALLESNGVEGLMSTLQKFTPSKAVYSESTQVPNNSGFQVHSAFGFLKDIKLELRSSEKQPTSKKEGTLMRIMPGDYRFEKTELSVTDESVLRAKMSLHDH